jgi:hypothetical protein
MFQAQPLTSSDLYLRLGRRLLHHHPRQGHPPLRPEPPGLTLISQRPAPALPLPSSDDSTSHLPIPGCPQSPPLTLLSLLFPKLDVSLESSPDDSFLREERKICLALVGAGINVSGDEACGMDWPSNIRRATRHTPNIGIGGGGERAMNG